jgi:hypothetical protein
VTIILSVPRTRQNPKILWVDDAEVVGDRITKASEDREHFAVTVNAVHALWHADQNAASRGLKYIEAWLKEPWEAELQWTYSPLLALYLLMRGNRLGGMTRNMFADRIAELVTARRREDGLWGDGFGESVETAIAILILDACGRLPSDVGPAADHLAQSQCDDGAWPWAPIVSDGDGQWFGQRVVSTLLCGGALALIRD